MAQGAEQLKCTCIELQSKYNIKKINCCVVVIFSGGGGRNYFIIVADRLGPAEMWAGGYPLIRWKVIILT